MTTPPVPSVINLDIPPPPRPDISAPLGDRSLSPDNSTSAPNKRSCTVSADDMEVETTTTSLGPISGLVSTAPAGLPINKVTVLTRPQTADTTLDSSIHVHPLPAPTDSAPNDKGKSVAFDVPKRHPSPDGNAAAINPRLSDFMLRHIYVTRLPRSKKNLPLIASCMTKWIELSPDFPLMALVFTAKDQETIKESLSSSLFKPIIPLASNPYVLIFLIWHLPLIHLQTHAAVMKKNLCSLLTFPFSLTRLKSDRPSPDMAM
ncbi:hypothetical protein RhiirA4_430160 [Rhizophagus irregularis]|uniref:Uncharacterized protein n=1 Tax=Rhizophagus irregularis TaxID=588596 RepID=A0A2I1HJN0_9GLOM|nr:hypothetical protein RhiirA4_430160 [Rhizophagus irregularis]